MRTYVVGVSVDVPAVLGGTPIREHWYHHSEYGSNLRMNEWQGAILSAQLARFPDQNATRNANAIALGES